MEGKTNKGVKGIFLLIAGMPAMVLSTSAFGFGPGDNKFEQELEKEAGRPVRILPPCLDRTRTGHFHLLRLREVHTQSQRSDVG